MRSLEQQASKRRPRNQRVTPKVVTGLVRVSKIGDRGKDGTSFLSPEEQISTMEAYCRQTGTILSRIFYELDRSGDTTEREGLQAALDHVYSVSDGLIVARVDRVARNLVQGLLTIHELRANGKAFIAPLDGIGAGGRGESLLLTFLLQMAEWQLETISENWIATRRRHVANGIASRSLYGYERDRDRRLVPVPAEAKVVRQIFRWRAQGVSWGGIADKLAAKGVPTRAGGRWTPSTIRRILSNRTYLGELHSGVDYDGNPIVNLAAHKAIVSVADWEAAQRARTVFNRREAQAFLLAGLPRCSGCGGLMRGNAYVAKPGWHNVREDTLHRYYRCPRKRGWGVCPAPASIRADQLEGYVLGAFADDFLDSTKVRPDVDDSALATARLALNDAIALLNRYLVADTTLALEAGDEVSQRAAEVGKLARMAKVAEARAEVDRLEREQGIGGLPLDVAEFWNELGDEDRGALLGIAYPVIAVDGQSRDGRLVNQRVRLWQAGEAGIPTDLPGRGNPISAIRPIALD